VAEIVLALGVDGGGTHTRCLIIDEQANIIGIGLSGASKPDAVDPETGRANLHEAILTACRDCGVESVDSVFIGMGGVVSAGDVQVVREMLAGLPFRPDIPAGIDHDIRIALAGGTAGQPGIALIVGTGSSCYGRNAAGDSWRSGGWGYILDDAGSGFYLGQQALMAVVRAFDGRGKSTALSEPVMAALGIEDVNQVMHHVYYPRLNHAGIAALAPLVTRIAEYDEVARDIIERGCADLAVMVATVAQRLDLPENVTIVPIGSLAESSVIVRQTLERAILQRLSSAQIRDAMAPPAAGAAFLALEQAGIHLPADLLIRLRDLLTQ
jgi:glucosamine kinase